MPVYKEGLHGVIKPTVQSVKQAISTYELQGGTANIMINDDGSKSICNTYHYFCVLNLHSATRLGGGCSRTAGILR
jgi:hypothetical protein